MQSNISAVRLQLISINIIISVIFSCFQLLLTSCRLVSATVMKINERSAVRGHVLALYVDYFNILQCPTVADCFNFVAFAGN